MAQDTATDEIAPITKKDLAAAADGHPTTVDELRTAVAHTLDELEKWGDEWADNEIPDGHGDFGEPTVIAESNDWVCIYVSHGSFGPTIEQLESIQDIDPDAAQAVPWAFNEFARRKGASPDALGTMDTVVLPRTERVEEIIESRE